MQATGRAGPATALTVASVSTEPEPSEEPGSSTNVVTFKLLMKRGGKDDKSKELKVRARLFPL